MSAAVSSIKVTRTLGLLLGLLAFLTYLPALRNDFVDWDDPIYVTGNSHVAAGLTPKSIGYALTTFDSNNWIPLTWLSLELDATLFGLNPAAFHAVNVFWHVCNVWLLFHVLAGLTNAVHRSATVAALFAVHPLHVESVAWVSERKDLLSTCALLLTLLTYHHYVTRPSRSRYAIVCGLMALGLLAKSMIVTLPILLCLLDVWPLQRVKIQTRNRGRVENPSYVNTGPLERMRIRTEPGEEPNDFKRSHWRLLVEKIPLVVLALGDALITMAAQRSAMTTAYILPIQTRLGNACCAYGWYLWKTFWPTRLCAFYQHPLESLSPAVVAGAAALLLFLTAYVVLRGSRNPALTFGWGWFVISLLPVIGLVQVGTQAYADRYAYIPHIGLLIAVVWELHRLLQRRASGKWMGIGLTITATGICVVLTNFQIQTWRDNKSLWTQALDLDRYNSIAHLQLGQDSLRSHDWNAAVEHYADVMVWRPADPDAILNLGYVHQMREEWDLAAEYYSWLLRLSPRHPAATRNLASLPSHSSTLRAPSPLASEKNKLGLRHARRGEFQAALRLFQEAVDLDPLDVISNNNAASALEELNRPDEAGRYYEQSLRARPTDVEARHGLDRIQKRQGRNLTNT